MRARAPCSHEITYICACSLYTSHVRRRYQEWLRASVVRENQHGVCIDVFVPKQGKWGTQVGEKKDSVRVGCVLHFGGIELIRSSLYFFVWVRCRDMMFLIGSRDYEQAWERRKAGVHEYETFERKIIGSCHERAVVDRGRVQKKRWSWTTLTVV